MRRKILGKRAEDIAAGFLKKKGLKILERNFSCRAGEIDIVARDKEAIVFIEVRSGSSSFCDPLESIGHKKTQRLKRVASFWLIDRRAEEGLLRFDVISVVFSEAEKRADITYIKDAF